MDAKFLVLFVVYFAEASGSDTHVCSYRILNLMWVDNAGAEGLCSEMSLQQCAWGSSDAA